MKTNKIAIVIPIYKNEPDQYEEESLLQCFKVLGTHPITFICGHNFNSSYYESKSKKYGIEFVKITFNDEYFNSKESYNQLCLTIDFYKKYSKFKFILIYQLDSWVFRDELEYWCNQEYDFIGAPFPNSFKDTKKIYFDNVGNGGFSLRRVKTMIKLFNKEFYRIKTWTEIKKDYNERISKNPIWYIYCIIRTLGFRNTISRKYLIEMNEWEDFFIADVNRYVSFICLPGSKEALQFSFEYFPSIAYIKNGNKLPMGCHGWNRIEYDIFWKQFIP